MDIPFELKDAMEKMLEGHSSDELRRISKQMTDRYKNESGRGRVLVSHELETQVYAAVRMPATYGAVCDALSYTLDCMNGANASKDEVVIDTVMDVGAGSGAGAWAAHALLQPKHIDCLEREAAMRTTGLHLMNEDESLKTKTTWHAFDLEKELFGTSGIPEKADWVLASYVLNEMSAEVRELVIRKLWAATGSVLTIVEPGTKEGFAVVKQIREILLAEGAHLLAPCSHESPCRLDEDDWCHFTCRVMRSRLHKSLKDADVPYEDEKYSYISFAREEGKPASARILRHPYVTKGAIDLELCTAAENTKMTIRKKHPAYKAARKAKMGDAIDLNAEMPDVHDGLDAPDGPGMLDV